MLMKAVIKWGASKALAEADIDPSTKRALQQGLRGALEHLAKKHPSTALLLHKSDSWEYLLTSALALLSSDGTASWPALALRLHNGADNPPHDLDAAITFLSRAVIAEFTRHPDLAGRGSIPRNDRYSVALMERTQHWGGQPDLDTIAGRCQLAAKGALSGHIHPDSVMVDALPPLIKGDGVSESVSLDSLYDYLKSGGPAVIQGEPGCGKTSLLLHLAECLPAKDKGTAYVFVHLPDWAMESKDLFDYIISKFQVPTSVLSADHLKFLSNHGRLSLLLDGWNELLGDRRERVSRALTSLVQDHPFIGLVISNRHGTSIPPLMTFEAFSVTRLGEEKREKLCQVLLGERADEFIDQIRCSPALESITRLPIYLFAAHKLFNSGTALSHSREALIGQMEDLHAVGLEPLESYRLDILTGLAAAMLDRGTSLPWQDAFEAIRSLPMHSTPAHALELLVSRHLLVKEGGDVISIRFQHHLFQEWYASRYVEKRIDKAEELRTILDKPSWGEAVALTVERLAGASPDLAAKILEHALAVEPLFAASLVRRVGDSTWDRVKYRFLEFAKNWHETEEQDRGLAFMIATGRHEFAAIIRPFLTNEDESVQLRTFDLVRPFPTGCLGVDWQSWYRDLDDSTRITIATQPVFRGGSEAEDFAAAAAREETAPHVIAQIIDALDRRGAKRLVREIMENADDGLWREVLSLGHLQTLDDNGYRQRRIDYLVERLPRASSLQESFERLDELAVLDPEQAKTALPTVLRRGEFPYDTAFWHWLDRAATVDATATGNRLIYWLTEGMDLPELTIPIWITPDEDHWHRLDSALAVVDDGYDFRTLPLTLPLFARLISARIPADLEQARYLVASLANWGRFECDAILLPLQSDMVEIIRNRMSEWRTKSGTDEEKRDFIAWESLLLGRMGVTRDIDFILGNLAAELKAFPSESRQRRQAAFDRLHCYQDACTALQCEPIAEAMISALADPFFSRDAAHVLFLFARRESSACRVMSPFHENGTPDFAIIAQSRRQRAMGRHARPKPHPYAAAILDQISRWRGSAEYAGKIRALAELVAGMEYGDRYQEVLEGVQTYTTTPPLSTDGYLRLVLAGEVLPVKPLIDGYDAALAASQRPGGRWQPVVDWLTVMVFSDCPGEAYARLRDDTLERRALETILPRLAHASDSGALDLLIELGADTTILAWPAWAKAMAARPEPEAARTMIDILKDEKRCRCLPLYFDPNTFAHSLAEWASRNDGVRTALEGLCLNPPSETARRMLIAIAYHAAQGEAGDEMLNRLLEDQPSLSHLDEVIDIRVVGQVSECKARAAPILRQRLLRMAHDGISDAPRLLDRIDRKRDAHGQPMDEPRHPDLGSRLSWPILRSSSA